MRHQAGLDQLLPMVELTAGVDDLKVLTIRCQGRVYFDRRTACAKCGQESFGKKKLGTEGAVRSFTIVHRAAPGIPTPYVSAIVDGLLWLVPWLARDYWPFVVAFAIVSGVGSGVFSLSFNVLSSSATDAARARVMTFAYLPLNLGFIVGPGLGAFLVSRDPFSIFPAATAFELAGVVLLAYAARRRIA